MSNPSLWKKFQDYYYCDRVTGFAIDISRMNFPTGFMASMEPKIQAAFKAMSGLESGAIANPDEKRMVGHYWLRDSGLAPSADLKKAIDTTLTKIKTFAAEVHSGKISPERGGKFRHILVVGIGGSALGPQFVNQALGNPGDPLNAFFFDNTDPEGMDKVLRSIPDLSRTLCIVTSKSGGTKETRNGQLVAKAAWQAAGLDFSRAFVAITGEGSELDKTATSEKWLDRFPMWDWVGGRTSEFSAVGLLPAALQGFDIDAILRGAAAMDEMTRQTSTAKNPAALMALMWHHAGSGKGTKDMVVLPYQDRLELFSRYLQQLVMESLGKERDLNGQVVNQGIAVYGNKGSTDQHAYVQQLRDGLNNFFSVFIEVLKDGASAPARLEVEPGVRSGDYLSGFFQGTRRALYESSRESITLTINEVSAFSIGQLIALFERAVGLYASLVNINAYHQPGVEAGKKAAAAVLELQGRIVQQLKAAGGPQGVEDVAKAIGESENTETVFKILQHLSANGRVKVNAGSNVFLDLYSY